MKKNQIITFSEENHSYFLEKERLESVNGVLKLYGFEFDSDYWSVHKAIEANVTDFYKLFFKKFNFEDRLPTQEQLIDYFSHLLGDICLGEEVCKVEDEWEESRTNGTLFHAYRETEAHERSFIVNPFTGEKFITQPVPKIPEGFANASHANMSKLKDGAHTELLIPSINHMIAGQADEVFIETIGKTRFVDIGDHKTNNKLPKLEGTKTLTYPLDHLIDCTYTKYQLQVSLYAYMMELHGYVPRTLGFYHYKNYDVSTKKVVTFKYLREECKQILDLHLALS